MPAFEPPRRGPKPKPAAESRTWVSARLSPAAADAMYRATVATGLSRSAVIEAALLAYAPLDRDGLATLPLP